MRLSVVVPTYRRPGLLRRCIDSLGGQDLDRSRFDVVVVDDGSGDETAQVLDECRRANAIELVALTQPQNAGPAAARNRGVAAATGELVLFLDDDVAAAPDLLSTHLRLHEAADDPLLGVLGRVDWHATVRRTAFLQWLDRSGLQFGYDTWLRPGPVDPPFAAFYTANVSARRELLDAVGGFEETFPYAAYEDIELAYRLTQRGFRLDYRPEALAFHTRSISLREFTERMERVGESAAIVKKVRPELPVTDASLRQGYVRRRALLAMRFATLAGSDAARNRYYWAAVAMAYARGLDRART